MEHEEHGHLDGLFDRISDLTERCHHRSAVRVAGEARRLARAERRLDAYLMACFHLVNDGQSLLDPAPYREIAMELIALLESEDRARSLQPDFDEDMYFHYVSWMTACAYDNLATHVANLQGYNSPGMQSCIADGIQVCRRTGKLECVACFREYATLVHLQADDVEMARHFAHVVSALDEDAPGAERRWVATKNLSWIFLLDGQLEAAERAAVQALALCPTYHNPYAARLETLTRLGEVLLSAGGWDRFERLAGAEAIERVAPPGEDPAHDVRVARHDALQACARDEFDAAATILEEQDDMLWKRGCLHDWFETRLRLVAARRLAGRDEAAGRLAEPLRARARAACDWLTIRRIHRLLDGSQPPTPLALPGPAGRDVAPVQPLTVSTPGAGDPAGSSGSEDDGPSALRHRVTVLVEAVRDAGDRDQAGVATRRLTDGLLAVDPAAVADPDDAAACLEATFLADPARGAALWAWAGAMAERFADRAAVISLQAAIGGWLSGAGDEALRAAIGVHRVRELFVKALDLDPDDPEGFVRAGLHHLDQGDLGEAERCLARGLRLDRTQGYAAVRLAEIYRTSDRLRDALEVLDLCIRHGNEDAPVAWDAALTALALEQPELGLSHLDRFARLVPEAAWTSYYRAQALLDLGRPDEAMQAIETETGHDPPGALHLRIVRCCAAADLGRIDECRREMEAIVTRPLRDVDYLTVNGLADLYERLWRAAAGALQGEPVAAELEDVLLMNGLAPEGLFEAARQREPMREGLDLHRCLVRQPLDRRWAGSRGCRAGEEGWSQYYVHWGVLAADRDEAERIVLSWQARCYPLPAVVEETLAAGESCEDRPGVLFQGYRGEEAEPDEEEG